MSNAKATVYSQCGVRFRSEIELHLPRAAGPEWDVDVRWGADTFDSAAPPPGEIVAVYEPGETSWYTATWTGVDYRMRFRDCGEFVISEDLSEVVVRPDPPGRVELLPILLAGTVSAFLLALRGHVILHASAVLVDGSALAFVGQSGRGKSTVAALMCVDGAELVTDDVLRVDTGSPVTCVGGAPELRLREKAAPIVDDDPDASTRTTADDRLAFAPTVAPPESLPLAGIVVPAPSRTATAVETERLDPGSALVALLSFPRVHGWQCREVLQREFGVLSQLANDVPVHTATIPWGPPFDPDVARALRKLAS
jgi:hypothetical protein